MASHPSFEQNLDALGGRSAPAELPNNECPHIKQFSAHAGLCTELFR